VPEGAVRLSGNESPFGPCPEALEAVHEIASQVGWYDPGGEPRALIDTVADMEGVKREYVHAFPGSCDPLHRAVFAFCGPGRALAIADPGYEAPEISARFVGAKVIRVPLRKDGSHDVRAMVARAPQAGLYFVCNPNNPTGTVTPRADLEWLLAHKPAGSVVLVDEAYIQYTAEPGATEFVAKDKDVMVLRTFSKLYGLAGLRAGLAIARPDLMMKALPWGAGRMSITGVVAATASLRSPRLVTERREENQAAREETLEFLEKKNLPYVAGAQANYFLMDAGQPARQFTAAMARENVFIGRTWMSLPNHCRVTVGSREDMVRFREAVASIVG
jgi:histidinol-phosphate aminotransferase